MILKPFRGKNADITDLKTPHAQTPAAAQARIKKLRQVRVGRHEGIHPEHRPPTPASHNPIKINAATMFSLTAKPTKVTAPVVPAEKPPAKGGRFAVQGSVSGGYFQSYLAISNSV